MEERKPRKRGSVVGPILLVTLGTIFLLNNLGRLEWTVWGTIIRMWPLLLVAIGIDVLIGRRSLFGGLLSLVLILALFAGGFWLFTHYGGVTQGLTAQEISQDLDDGTRAEVVIEPGVGALSVTSLADSSRLVTGVIRLNAGEEVERSFHVEDGTARFVLSSDGSFGPTVGVWDENRTWDLRLNADVPLHLSTNVGAGQTTLDLTGMTMSGLEVDAGVGQVIVTLPAEGRFQATVDLAIGQMVIRIPAGMAVRVECSTALVSRQLPPGYSFEEDVYTSPGYPNADNRIEIELDQAMGSLVIEQVGE